MSKASSARRMAAALAVAALAGLPLFAHAQVYKCPQPNGTIGFQATPCPTSGKPAPHPTSQQLNAQRASAPAAGKPYDDPYASNVGSRPYLQAPAAQQQSAPNDTAAARKTANLVADVQARNRRENQEQAYQDAHKNDKSVDTAACNSARHNLGVLNEQRPVFSYDNKGNRVFVEDKDRAARIAEAQRAIAASCP